MAVDETTLMAWIADWELSSVEFKQTLNLQSKDDKGEFVKDVIALANSAPETQGFVGYLVIGVSDDRMIVGTEPLEEERIQQIVQTYVHPSLSLRCSTLSTQTPGWLQVGIIQIGGYDRPYSISRSIGKWQQGDVFVRKGSVVFKATKEDIIRMSSEAQGTAEVRRYVKAAETHIELGNFREAVETYSSALRLSPTASIYLARAHARRRDIESTPTDSDEQKRTAKLALKDASDALVLSDSFSLQKEARFERVRLNNLTFVDYDDWIADIDWLIANTTGREHGEVLFRQYQALEDHSGISGNEPIEVISAMDTALAHGFSNAGVYHLRARAKFEMYDCSLALHDIHMALEMASDPASQVAMLSLEASIFVRMCRFEEARESLSKARQLSVRQFHSRYSDPLGYIADGLEGEILWRYALEAEFSSPRSYSSGPAVVSALLADIATQKSRGIAWTLRRYALIMNSLKSVVGEDFWNRWRSGQT